MSLIILAPEMPKAAPQPKLIRPAVVVDRFDRKLLAAVEDHSNQPAPVWGIVHQIVADEHAPSRAHRRQLVARLLCRVRGLIVTGAIERVDRAHVRLPEPVQPPEPAPPKQVENVPSVPYPTVMPTPAFQSGGPRRRVFKV